MREVAPIGVLLAATGILFATAMTLVVRAFARSLAELYDNREHGRFWTVLCGLALGIGCPLAGLLGFWWGAVGLPALTGSPHAAVDAWARGAVWMVRMMLSAFTAGMAALAGIVGSLTARRARGEVCPRPPS